MSRVPDLPDTAACIAAERIARRHCSASLFNHSVRSYMWASVVGRQGGTAFDPELLYVAALLHDLGLTEAFDNHTLPFEKASGHVAWVFGVASGWPEPRCARAAEVVERHMQESVAAGSDPEGHLLHAGTRLDIAGMRASDIPGDLVAGVLARWPRLELAVEFATCVADQGARKPDSIAAAAAPWLPHLLKAHPHAGR